MAKGWSENSFATGKWCFTSCCRAESERTAQLGGAWLEHMGMSLFLFLPEHLVGALALIAIPKNEISCYINFLLFAGNLRGFPHGVTPECPQGLSCCWTHILQTGDEFQIQVSLPAPLLLLLPAADSLFQAPGADFRN